MTPDPNFSTIWLSFLALAGGLAMLAAGGEFLISGAAKLALKFGMSPLLIGLTVVAFGTSMPELFVSISAVTAGHPEIMIGNVIGSNIANIGLILGISALLAPLPVYFSTVRIELYLVILASLGVIGITFLGTFYRIFGVFYVGTLIAYTYLSYRNASRLKKMGETQFEFDGSSSFPLIVLLVCGGLILLALGSELFIRGAVDIARFMGISELVIGLTLAAVGTSLPELASCISAVRNKHSELLIGNLVGSNLFNLMMVFGATALISPFYLPSNLLFRDLPVMTFFSFSLVPLIYYRQKISRLAGFMLLAGYLIYLFLLS